MSHRYASISCTSANSTTCNVLQEPIAARSFCTLGSARPGARLCSAVRHMATTSVLWLLQGRWRPSSAATGHSKPPTGHSKPPTQATAESLAKGISGRHCTTSYRPLFKSFLMSLLCPVRHKNCCVVHVLHEHFTAEWVRHGQRLVASAGSDDCVWSGRNWARCLWHGHPAQAPL